MHLFGCRQRRREKVLNIFIITHKLLSLNEVFGNYENKLENDKPAFLEMLGNTIDFDTLIAPSFYLHFYTGIGRSRKYPLDGSVGDAITADIFHSHRFTFDFFLKYSQELLELPVIFG